MIGQPALSHRVVRRHLALGVAAATAAVTVTAGVAAAGPVHTPRHFAHGARSAVSAGHGVGSAARPGELRAVFALQPRLPRPGALAALAHSTRHTPAAHAAAVRKLRAWAPSAATQHRVAAWVRAHGLRVSHSDGWTMSVTGTRSAFAKALGVRFHAVAAPRSTTGARRYIAPAQAAHVPAALHGAVTAVAGLDTRPLMRPLGLTKPRLNENGNGGYAPSELRTAYSASGNGRGLTVATVQFSRIDGRDPATYAHAFGIPLPLGQILAVPVDGAGLFCGETGQPGCGPGEGEVALDTEMLLGTAPAANQRLYIEANGTSDSGLDLYSAMADDALAGKIQVTSSSWGFCEKDVTDQPNGGQFLTVFRQDVQRLVAAGSTFFSATGDAGSKDCTSGPNLNNDSVDVPADIPETIGVGGTSLEFNPDSTQTANFTETGWSGSGGGVSGHFAKPAYQSAIIGAGRLLPDISAIADPNTGISAYDTFDDPAHQGFGVIAGGTSAATPINAGLLASALSAAHINVGVGDLHTLLYNHATYAPATNATFRDSVTGNNGTFTAAAGYDEVTGLGSPLWSKLAPAIGLPASGASTRGLLHEVSPVPVFGGSSGATLHSGVTKTITLHHGVPANAQAAALDVITSRGTKSSSLAVFAPNGTRRGNVFYTAGQKSAHEVTVRLAAGKVKVHNTSGTVHVSLVLDGWYGAASPGAADYHPASDLKTAFSDTIARNHGKVVPIRGHAGVPASATAVVVQLTATKETHRGAVSAYTPGSAAHPVALAFGKRQAVENTLTLKLNSAGKIALRTVGAKATVAGVIAGYFRPAAGDHGGASYHPLFNQRLFDTRDGFGFSPPQGFALGKGDSVSFQITNIADLGVPVNGPVALVLDLGATRGTRASVLTGNPHGAAHRPGILHWAKGQTVSTSLFAHQGTSDGNSRTYVLRNAGAGTVRIFTLVEGYFGA